MVCSLIKYLYVLLTHISACYKSTFYQIAKLQKSFALIRKKSRFIPFVLNNLTRFYRKTVVCSCRSLTKIFQWARNKKDRGYAGSQWTRESLLFTSVGKGDQLPGQLGSAQNPRGGGSLNPPKHRQVGFQESQQDRNSSYFFLLFSFPSPSPSLLPSPSLFPSPSPSLFPPFSSFLFFLLLLCLFLLLLSLRSSTLTKGHTLSFSWVCKSLLNHFTLWLWYQNCSLVASLESEIFHHLVSKRSSQSSCPYLPPLSLASVQCQVHFCYTQVIQ